MQVLFFLYYIRLKIQYLLLMVFVAFSYNVEITVDLRYHNLI